ncbi:MAG: MBOAT family protein [Sulfurospirillum sp.]|nr:MAG: MBOAT family protein [Sulfurospirillum sp.]
MLFNSYEFIFFFLPLVYLCYFLLQRYTRPVYAKVFLVLSSLFFYSWWNPVYLPLILGSMLFNYLVGRQLSRQNRPKYLLIIGVGANLALLGYFKYADFFISNANFLFGTKIPLLHLVLPLAISFFTFQQIAYLVDSYRHETKEYNFLNYALFVTFFPQLIAGPIVHHKEMMPQFSDATNRHPRAANIAEGLFIFAIGLFKKAVIADTFAVWATEGFSHPDALHFADAWITSLSYTFQLYFDFSGYTDMAIGAALLFNIRLPQNFDSPYKATSIQDFWRRWHITLSRFLRDYIYIPLGGNRKSEPRTYYNLMTTFLLGGIWHGAGWTFLFWGALHGAALVLHRLWKKAGKTMPLILAWFVTFMFINISWVFFRAKDFHDAFLVLKGMSGYNGFSGFDTMALSYIAAAFVIVLFFQNSNQLVRNQKVRRYTFFITAMLFLFALLQMFNISVQQDKVSEFLYFNF